MPLHPYKPEVIGNISKRYRYRINKSSRETGLNYDLYIWTEIERILIKKRDLNILDDNFLDKYKRSFDIFIKEVNEKEYINYYSHIEIIEESGYKNIEKKKEIYLYERIKKIILDILDIKPFIDDGIGYLGVLFYLQIELKSTLYVFNEKEKYNFLLNFYESRFPEYYKKRYNRDSLIGNIYNPNLDKIIKKLLNINKKEKRIEKEINIKEEEDILKDILKIN